VVLPNKAKKYMQSFGYKSKNDKIDARGLSRMGAEQHLDLWHPYSENIYPLRSLTRHNEDLQQEKTVAGNRLEAQTYSSHPNKSVCKHLNSMIKLIDKQIVQTKSEINTLIDNDVILKEKFEKVETIKGVGRITVATVIAETNGFTLFNNMRQLTSFAGYDIVEKQSGNTSGKTRISKRGNSHIRRALHMPSFSAVRHDSKNIGVFYNRIYENTGYKMKGYTAVQRKLLCLIYTLWNKNEPYIENYEELKNKEKLEKKDIKTVSENKGTSGEKEQKSLFLHCSEGTKKVPAITPGV
ncbi:MAG: IS110 family transposase, partial [Bacilli bacterium]